MCSVISRGKRSFVAASTLPAVHETGRATAVAPKLERNFDVYLYYPHLKVYFFPNARYSERWG
jgi:hypothetical protein